MKKQYRSDVCAAIHETMEDLYAQGIIPKKTMKEFDETCLAPIEPLTGEDIRSIREKQNMSQPVFARYLNVSKTVVSEWERGTKKPGGPALRLLAIIKNKGLDVFAST